MKSMHGIEIETVESRLLELDRKIAEVSVQASRLLEQAEGSGTAFARAEDEIGFLRHLWVRRETLLNEYRKSGGGVKDLYTHRAAALAREEAQP